MPDASLGTESKKTHKSKHSHLLHGTAAADVCHNAPKQVRVSQRNCTYEITQRKQSPTCHASDQCSVATAATTRTRIYSSLVLRSLQQQTKKQSEANLRCCESNWLPPCYFVRMDICRNLISMLGVGRRTSS